MAHIHVDFETRSTVDLTKQGTWNYSVSPDTSMMCLAVAVDDEPPFLVVGEGYPEYDRYKHNIDRLRNLASDSRNIFYAHNATFEMYVWENILNRQYDIPIIPIERWVCTMALAYMFNLPGSLDKVGDALGLNTRKDKEGSLVLQQLCKPRKVPRKQEWRWDNTPEKFIKLYEYCITDVEVERLITKKLPRLLPFEREVWEMDKHMNRVGMQIDLDLIESAEQIFDTHKELLKPRFKKITRYQPTQVAKVIQWLIKDGVPEKKLTKVVMENGVPTKKRTLDSATIEKLLNDDEITSLQKEVITIRKAFSKSSVAKYQAFKKLSDSEGILRDYLIYGRAVTMRWGGNGAQPQNLPSRGCAKNQKLLVTLIKKRDYGLLAMLYPDISQALSSAIRGVIIARPGNEIIVSDYAAIEARVAPWLAGDRETCKKFVNGADLYVDMAKVIYEDNSINKKDNPKERNLGKAAMLGASYGMGADKFHETCLSWGIEIDKKLAEKAIKAYRNTYHKIVDIWNDLGDSAIYAVEHPGQKVPVMASEGKVHFMFKGSYLFCVLPSGRSISYPYPRVETKLKTFYKTDEEGNRVESSFTSTNVTYMKEDSTTRKWVRTDTYGPKIFENCVQSIARDIMAIGGMNCNKAGYDLRLMVHDEAIAEVPKGYGSVEEFERLLADLPPWADGCPIKAADGWRGTRYRK